MMTDPIADMLTRIRNAYLARLDRTQVPASKLKRELAKILVKEGYVADYRIEEGHPPSMTIFLKYGADRRGAMVGIKRSSRPGRRYYVGHDAIPKVNGGLGVAILSTSKGMMTDREARHERVGGEVLCEVW